MLILRIQVPDVPGALGKVATTMGTVDADISAVEIVEKGDGYAIDDFILSLPTETMPDTLVSTCDQLKAQGSQDSVGTIRVRHHMQPKLDCRRSSHLVCHPAPVVRAGVHRQLQQSDGALRLEERLDALTFPKHGDLGDALSSIAVQQHLGRFSDHGDDTGSRAHHEGVQITALPSHLHPHTHRAAAQEQAGMLLDDPCQMGLGLMPQLPG